MYCTLYSVFCAFFVPFRRHRCPHGPTTDETTTIFDEVTSVENVSAYRKDFIDNQVTNYEILRTPAVKPIDNLRPEGEFYSPEKEKFRPADRPQQFKPSDNLRPEGDFQRPERTEFKPAERPQQVKPTDNLRPEGEFYSPEKDAFRPAERPKQVKPSDNLRPEGDFQRPEKPEFRPAERLVATKPQDNLFVSGDFEGNFDKNSNWICDLKPTLSHQCYT